MALRSGFPLAAERPLYSGLIDTRHCTTTHDTFLTDVTTRNPPLRARSRHPHSEGGPPSPRSSLLFAFRWLRDDCGARPPLLAFFGRGPAAVSSSLPDPADSASGDPAPDPLGEDGGIGSHPLPLPGGRARSPWSTSRARTRGLSIVLGSPPPPKPAPPQARGVVALPVEVSKIAVIRLPLRRAFPGELLPLALKKKQNTR